jgi:formylglycine-generating enzyme required for sulfatase activity
VKIFISYSSKDRALVEPIHYALAAQNHDVFFDREDLPAGVEYDARIRAALEASDLFIYMLSPDSVVAGSYTFTELDLAQQTWPHPSGRVLPVMLRVIDMSRVPAYLKSVTVLEPQGNIAAAVVDAVHRLAAMRRRRWPTIAGIAALLVVVTAAAFYWSHRERTVITGKDGAPAVLLPGARITLGDDVESPMRTVYVDDFYLDRFEVTTARFAKFMEATGSVQPPDRWEEVDAKKVAELPVIGIDWHDADGYCRWAGKRLPTEAEWERAARGNDARPYPWGKDAPTSQRAQFAQDVDSPYRGGLAKVGAHADGRSANGIDDLAGNASEWVADWYSEIFSQDDARNPRGPNSGTGKVIRGGSWEEAAERLLSTKRSFASPDARGDEVGFRCAHDR